VGAPICRIDARTRALDVGFGDERQGIGWKAEIADQHQRELGTSLVWLAQQLQIPRPANLRTLLWRLRKIRDK